MQRVAALSLVIGARAFSAAAAGRACFWNSGT
jgi:hypothetical protein